MKKGSQLLSIVSVLLLGGCALTPNPLTDPEITSQNQTDHARIFADVAPINHPLTQAEVIARALRYNLNHRVKMVEELLAQQQLGVNHFDLLPRLTAAAGYNGRSNVSASVSQSLRTGNTSLEASTSQDRDRFTGDLTFSWNLLDFGVSYFNARQKADQVLIAGEQRNKVVYNLIQNVQSAFWRAAAAQHLEKEVAAALKEADEALRIARQEESENLRSPLESLQYQRTLLDTIRQLETVEAELGKATVELAGLIRVRPGTRVELVLPADEQALKPAAWKLPLEEMEAMALLRNPELREINYQTRISVDETRKALLRLLPGITLDLAQKHDTNSFLVNKSWGEASSMISFNLFNLLSAPSRIESAETDLELTHAKRLNLHMAILTQVHLAMRQYGLAEKQLARAESLHGVNTRITQHTANRQEQDLKGQLERISAHSAAILSGMRRFLALSDLHAALGQIKSTLGVALSVGDPLATDLPTLTRQVEELLQAAPGGSGKVESSAPTPTKSVVAKEEKAEPGPTTALRSGLVKSPTRVRATPEMSAAIVRVLTAGTPVRLVALDPSKLWGQLEDRSGWIALQLLQPEAGADG